MDYLHTQTKTKEWIMVHGNLHITNVLVTDESTALISGFGLCEIFGVPGDPAVARSEVPQTAHQAGLPDGDYVSLAPEAALRTQARSVKSDVYSFGILMFEAGARPSRAEMGSEHTHVTDALWELITTCWAQEPSARPRMDKVHVRLS
ncbi:kinase-like protein [Auricularia subglabra TFB-10046 SS5]|nr:kinase-like protein [Auricularia subglabra TFB-10046 SS5]